MAQRNRGDDNRSRGSDSKFYLPAGFSPPFEAGLVERIWETLFNHGVDPLESMDDVDE